MGSRNEQNKCDGKADHERKIYFLNHWIFVFLFISIDNVNKVGNLNMLNLFSILGLRGKDFHAVPFSIITRDNMSGGCLLVGWC